MLGMTWQHTFVFWEMFASGVLSAVFIARKTTFQRKPWPWLLVSAWDIGVLLLLLFGTRAVTWQIQMLAMVYAVLIPATVWNTFRRKEIDLSKDSKSAYVITVLMTLLYTGLLVAGQP